ncbi:hypothetical protein F4604DRAFT_1931467 [Suillus subluteus]|nr:hypothetical protein F4604DRAFT_1931467 [Suillus subluteus]
MAASTHDVPEKTGQQRVRTSWTNVNGITNGIADTTGKNGSLATLMPDFSAWQKGQGAAVCSIWAGESLSGHDYHSLRMGGATAHRACLLGVHRPPKFDAVTIPEHPPRYIILLTEGNTIMSCFLTTIGGSLLSSFNFFTCADLGKYWVPRKLTKCWMNTETFKTRHPL